MKQIGKIITICLATTIFLAGCGNNQKHQSSSEPESSSTLHPSPQISSTAPVVPVGNLNPLTGHRDLNDTAVGKRPVAVMVSNIKKALPQRGIGSADIVYEAVTEGGITRLLTVFADYATMPNTGPVRSVREYYPELAHPLNALFVHYGGSDTGYAKMSNLGMNNIDGMSLANIAFTQDKKLASSKGKEHSNFISGETLIKGIEKKGYPIAGDVKPLFNFVQGAVLSSGVATDLSVPFSGYVTAQFTYDATTKKYLKSEFGAPQIDANTQQQIAVDNVFVIYTDVSGASDGSERMQIMFNKGEGIYCSNGTYENVHWSKGDAENPFVFTNASGVPLQVNPGKTWFCIVSTSKQAEVTIE